MSLRSGEYIVGGGEFSRPLTPAVLADPDSASTVLYQLMPLGVEQSDAPAIGTSLASSKRLLQVSAVTATVIGFAKVRPPMSIKQLRDMPDGELAKVSGFGDSRGLSIRIFRAACKEIPDLFPAT